MTSNLIKFDDQNKVFHLHNKQISYLLSIEDGGTLSHLYFGGAVKNYNNQLKYPRLDRGFSGNLPESIVHFHVIHFQKNIVVLVKWTFILLLQ